MVYAKTKLAIHQPALKGKRSLTMRYLRRFRWRMLLFSLFAVLSVMLTMATALSVADFLKLLFQRDEEVQQSGGNMVVDVLNWLYEQLSVYGQFRALVYFSLLVFVTYMLKNVFSYLSSVEMYIVRYKVVREIRNDMFDKTLCLSMRDVVRNRKGDMLSRFSTDIVEYDDNILNSIHLLLNAVVCIVLYMAMLCYINVKLTGFVLCMLPIVAFVISGITRHLRRTSVELQQRGSWLMKMMEETMMGLKIIKAYTAIDFSNRRFRQYDEEYTRLRTKVYRRIDLASPVSEFLGNVIVIGILLFGTMLVQRGDNGLSAELFVSYIMLFVLMITPVKDLSTAVSTIKKGRGCQYRLQQLLDMDDEPKGGEQDFATLERGIEFRGMSFSYTGSVEESECQLIDINIFIPKGRTIAIVGSSGSGKSTMAAMLCAYYLPTRGSLLVDGVPIEQYRLSTLRRRIGVVAQDTMLFNDTVARNIAFGTAGATRQDIERAARIANAHDFIMRLPEGYETNIGDRGDLLSGGQRQRLAIARAILRQPDILIFDEATSALDTESERQVQQALDKLLQGRTAIVIAHRLSTIVGADMIVVLEHGRIVEQGDHATLMAKGGRYRQLVELQTIGNGADGEQKKK